MPNTSGEVLGCLAWLGIVVVSVASGILSFRFIEPHTIGGVLGCLITWVVVTRIAYSVITRLVLAIFIKRD